jgi:hypothetical protein
MNEVFTNPASMNSFHEQEHRASREFEMAWVGGGREKVYSSGYVVLVCGINRTTGKILVPVGAINLD